MEVTPQQRYGAVTAAQVRALDAAAVELGVDIVQLMELAGFQVARLAWRLIGRRPRPVHVVAGHGNNGGDALVAARHLSAWGCIVTAVVHAEPKVLADVVARQAAAARQTGVDLVASTNPDDTITPVDTALTVDGLLGIGLRGAPRPAQAEVISGMRGAILSIDIPSGVDADTGGAVGVAVRARATCTLTACKQGFWSPGARAWTGDLHVADIGMPRQAWRRCGLVPPSGVRGGGLRRVPALG